MDMRYIKKEKNHLTMLPERHLCKRREEAGVFPNNYPDYDEWVPHFAAEEKPLAKDILVCSYCGGIKPSSALQLLNNDWVLEPTDKGYKRYMDPPGGHWRAMMRSGGLLVYFPPENSPMVKMYTQHLTEEDRNEFNAALEANVQRREERGDKNDVSTGLPWK